MKEIFKLSKREKKIAKKAMNEAVVRKFTEEEIEALMKSLTITKEKVQKSFMKYGAQLEKEQKLEEALEVLIPFNAKARRDKENLMRYKKMKNRKVREVEKPIPIPHYFRCGFTFVDGSELKLPSAAEMYRKRLMENIVEDTEKDELKHYHFTLVGGKVYKPEEMEKIIKEIMKTFEAEDNRGISRRV